MNLLGFVQQPINDPAPEPEAAPAPAFPITITWPAGAPIAAIGGQWRRLEDGRIETVFYTKEELEICITLSKWRSMEEGWGQQLNQTSMFNITSHNYSEG